MIGQVRPCAVYLLLAALRQGFPRLLMISQCLCPAVCDIKAVKEAVVEYERIAGAKVNFDKSEGLRLGAWRGSNTLPGPFRWSDGPSRILGVWFGPDLQLERNWSEVQTKVNAQVGIWLSRRLSLKGRVGGVRHVRLPSDPLPIGCTSSA